MRKIIISTALFLIPFLSTAQQESKNEHQTEEDTSLIYIRKTKEYIAQNPNDFKKRLLLGGYYLQRDSTNAAQEIFERLIQDIINNDITFKQDSIENIYLSLADTYKSLNDLIEAEFYYNLSLEKVIVKGKIDKIIEIYKNLAIIYSNQSLYQEELDATKKSEIYLKKKYEDDPLANSKYDSYKYNNYRELYTTLGDAYIKLKNYEKSLDIMDKLLPYIENDTSQEFNDTESDYFFTSEKEYYYALYYHNKGYALLELDELDSASKYLFLALEINESAGDFSGMVYDYWKIGDYYKKIQNETLSNKYYFKSLAISDTLEASGEDISEWLHSDLIECYQSIAENYETLGDYQKALVYEKKAKTIIQKYFKEQSQRRVKASTTSIEKTVRETKERERKRIEESRYNNLVYLSILFGILGTLGFIISLGRVTIINKYRRILTSMILLAIFEFFNLLLGPFFDKTLGADPLTQFSTNFALSIVISSLEFIGRTFYKKWEKKKEENIQEINQLIQQNPL
ncbi:MAG: hypothetical protein QM536_09390 [Chitinophagaceae bacterium]|nr:hypothetical protein [Chitinophagaceae bacterium]